YFCDADLRSIADDFISFEEVEELGSKINEMLARHEVDYVVTTSGAELLEVPKRLGTPAGSAEIFMDKKSTQDFFEKIGVLCPKKLDSPKYPCMVKTLSGAGGWRNTVVNSDAELKAWEEFVEHVPYMMQEFVVGLPASVCCLGTGTDAFALTSNEQILRGGETCAYAFSGSVTPCSHPLAEKMKSVAEKIVKESGCVGTVGVDFVLTDDCVYAIEVNPRFQGTVETVEKSLGINLFRLHLDACFGKLPEKNFVPQKFAVRKILTAPCDMFIEDDLSCLSDFITDIPLPHTFFEEGEVMFSVTGFGSSRAEAMTSLDKNIRLALQHIKE
ncbi:MAG: ATP-grasp domain-containing protein, partial [Methanocorpusculum sp.]|nr:ATP-grasp domain-containing protein [Methanocorpusculum sp.]